MRFVAMLLALLLATDALAQPAFPPLPRPRPAMPADVADDTPPIPRPRPLERPDVVPDVPPAGPERVFQAACPAVLQGRVEAALLPPIEDGLCIARAPFTVSALLVGGRMVPLSSPATLECGMATLLPDWAAAIDGYLRARENTGLARILVGTSYACRPRNNAAGADLSEHGFANALDVIGFELEDGRVMSLPSGWADPNSPAGRALRFAHGSACARFTTTLGPEANALHADHLHVDLGCHGERCVARLCE